MGFFERRKPFFAAEGQGGFSGGKKPRQVHVQAREEAMKIGGLDIENFLNNISHITPQKELRLALHRLAIGLNGRALAGEEVSELGELLKKDRKGMRKVLQEHGINFEELERPKNLLGRMDPLHKTSEGVRPYTPKIGIDITKLREAHNEIIRPFKLKDRKP